MRLIVIRFLVGEIGSLLLLMLAAIIDPRRALEAYGRSSAEVTPTIAKAVELMPRPRP